MLHDNCADLPGTAHSRQAIQTGPANGSPGISSVGEAHAMRESTDDRQNGGSGLSWFQAGAPPSVEKGRPLGLGQPRIVRRDRRHRRGRLPAVLEPEVLHPCDQWAVGSGMTAAGRKYWPNSTYQIESSEFRVTFRTNAQGYRARPGPSGTGSPYRIAFVGDSFTEGMQVDYDKTFCALIERGLAGSVPGRAVVCENYGVAATDLFEYWHRSRTTSCGPLRPMRWSCASSPGTTSPASCRMAGSMLMAVPGASITRNRAGSCTSRRG